MSVRHRYGRGWVLVKMWEWRRSRINRAAHDLPPAGPGARSFQRHSSAQRPSPAQPGGGRHTHIAKRALKMNR
jgi:hypothetical protein